MNNLTIRPAAARGEGHSYWLDSRHSFSFGDYYDPAHEHFRSLRVINEDWVAPSAGFPTHGHKHMEIITYVLEGELAHKDDTGGNGVIRPGEIQYMSAGSGIRHSEYNASDKDTAHLLQIWIMPKAAVGEPMYAQQTLDPARIAGKFGLLVSEDGRDGSIKIRQDADLWAAKLKAGETTSFTLKAGRGGWLQMARGDVVVNDQAMQAGDGASWSDTSTLQLTAKSDSEILLFDLA